MATEPLIDRSTSDTQPLTTENLAAAASARQALVSDESDEGRERSEVGYRSAAGSQPEEESPSLFEQAALEGFRSRWGTIQTGFVEDPGASVKHADELVAEVMKRLTEVFADERANLEKAWARGDDVSTEDLRVALRRYRSFFDRLLSI